MLGVYLEVYSVFGYEPKQTEWGPRSRGPQTATLLLYKHISAHLFFIISDKDVNGHIFSWFSTFLAQIYWTPLKLLAEVLHYFGVLCDTTDNSCLLDSAFIIILHTVRGCKQNHF